MKVAVLNYTGTVGKTTIAAHLLSPRMNNAPIFAIETINETAGGNGLDVEKIRGDKFRDLFKKLMVIDDAIIDVGASNVEAFLDGMVKFEDSHMEFDSFVIPVTSGSKEQKETISMVSTLSDFGIPAEKIHLIFNRVESDVAEEFGPVLNFVKKSKSCIANPEAAIFENELFDMLSVKKLAIGDVLADETDYKAKARELGKDGDAKQKSHYSDMHIIKALSKSVNRNLDTVFAALF
ncbi:StbB family protein [Duganella callida]|uniref:Plasmid stability protein StbB n=1 Tax=Duganella callida TaxID=2561932 RepID=A0A4Y9SPH3_9BURK|nr:StbB family protein [Duganella callida]TFW28468.1 plasmid stability protein StbB [Duganella callida]